MTSPSETSLEQRLNLSSDQVLRRRFMVINEEVKANIRVGLLLEVLDTLAEETALGYVRKTAPSARVVTASIDDLAVCSAPDIHQDILLRAQINFVGTTSMEVGIRIEQSSNPVVHIGSCFFTMVARESHGDFDKSVPLPDLNYTTADDFRRRSRALQRRDARRRAKKPDHPSPAEYALLHTLHSELAEATAPALVKNLIASGWERTYPEHENVPQKIFGGYVAHRAYMYAHICAEMICDQRPLLVASDRIDFYQPVRMGDKLHFVSRITYTAETSLRVETAITRVSRDRTVTALSNTCAFTFVNVDAELRRLPVPRVYPSDFLEDARYLAGHRCRARYLDAKAEG